MNAHDSEKVVGTLLSAGLHPGGNARRSRTGPLQHVQHPRQGRTEGLQPPPAVQARRRQGQDLRRAGLRRPAGRRENLRAARRTSAWSPARPATPGCREMLVQLEAGNRRVTGLSLDTDETFDTPFTRRDNPHRAYITIIEGCDKSCAYCVVPFTRGPERSRTSESVMAEARRLADAGYTEIQLLGQNVNSYRDPSPRDGTSRSCSHASARSPASAACASPPRHPRDFVRGIVDAIDANPALCNHVHLPVQSGSTRVLAAHAPPLHPRRVHAPHRVDEEREAPYSHHHRHHRRLPRRDRATISSRRSSCSTRSSTIRSSASSTRRGPIRRARLETGFRKRKSSAAWRFVQEKQRAIQIRRNAELIGTVQEVLVEGRNPGARPVDRPHLRNRTLNFTHRGRRMARPGRHVPARARHARRSQLAGG